jgi:hypothetical protein
LAEGFSQMRNMLAPGEAMAGPRLAAADLFDVLPMAVVQAQYTPARRERPKARVSVAAK